MRSEQQIKEIFAQETCYFDGEKKAGHVLAFCGGIVCFQVQGDYWGQWVPLESLTSPVINKKVFIRPFTPAPVNLPLKTDSVAKSERKVPVPLSSADKTKMQFKADINALVKFINTLQKSIQGKATQEIKFASCLLTESKKTREESLEASNTSFENPTQKILQLLNVTTTGTEQETQDFLRKIVENWNPSWQGKILEAITILNVAEKASVQANIIKTKYSSFSNTKLAQESINEKAIYAVAVGLSSVVAEDSLMVNLSCTIPLFIQMIYEIAFAYQKDMKPSEMTLDILAILGLLFTSDNLPKLDLEFLLVKSSIESWEINPTMNVMLFLGLGYAACQYYQTKLNNTNPLLAENYTQLGTEVTEYLSAILAQSDKIKEILNKTISLMDKLPIISSGK